MVKYDFYEFEKWGRLETSSYVSSERFLRILYGPRRIGLSFCENLTGLKFV